MLEVVPYVIASILVLVAWITGLVYFDAFTPADVRAWRRLAAMRGYATARSTFEKAVRDAKFLRRIQEELDLRRLLAITGSTETPVGFIGHLAFISFSIMMGTLVADFLFRMWQGDWFGGVGPWICVVAAGCWVLLGVSQMRRKARIRQEQADRALGDSMMLVGIMTDGRGLQLDDSVKILSRCIDHNALESIVDHRGWSNLLRGPYGSTIELYRAIAEQYGIPMFAQVADAAANTQVGIAERDMYTRLAKSVYAHRLADARERAAKAKTLVTMPVAGMLIPLLILLIAPTLSSIASGLGGH